MVHSNRWIVSILAALLILPAAVQAEESAAMLGATFGTTGIKGSNYFELGGDLRAVTLGIDALWFHSSWFLLAGDFSKALNSERTYSESDGGSYTWGGSAWYVDVLAGARYQLGSGSFLYFGAGVTLAGGDYEMTRVRQNGPREVLNADISTTTGFVTGAGIALQAHKNVLVFLRLRHRIVTADSDFAMVGDDDTVHAEFDLGGLETAVGVGFML